MRIDVVTLFPEMIRALAGFGIQGRAIARGLVDLVTWNPRDYTLDRHGSVDDKPYGGGPGMVMQVQPLRAAIQAAKSAGPEAPVIYLSPQGGRFTQGTARRLAARERLILLAGRYEGIDERLIDLEVDEEISIGDYVLSGGELPVLVVLDAVTRLLPGALGDADSAQEDSFMDGLLDYPHYTRPEQIGSRRVPQVLLSGNHAAIHRWRRKQALGRTRLRRPDLLEALALDDHDRALLNEFFEGVVIARRNRGMNSAFTVRKISHGEGVERVFQTHSPAIASIKLKRRGDVRRAKLYYLRERSGKSARIKEKL